MNKSSFFKKKKKVLVDLITRTTNSNINTGAFSEKVNSGWVTKIKVLPVGIISFAALLTAIGFYINYTVELDKNRQEVAHIADLRQLSERVEKNSNLIKTADREAFNELADSKIKIEKIMKVLNDGGKIEPQNTEIDPINEIYRDKFTEVQKDWTNNRLFIDALLLHKEDLINLKKTVSNALNNSQTLNSNVLSLQRLLKGNNQLEILGQELYILRIRIDQNLSNLFSGETFSLATGYELIKDLRLFDKNIDIILNGDINLGIERATNPEIINTAIQIKKVFIPYNNTIIPLLGQIDNLNATKDVSKIVAKTANKIAATAEYLNKSFVVQVDSLNGKRTLAIIFFTLSLSGFALLAFVFYEKSLQALRFAKVLEKNQTNETAVNLLIEQMKPLDNGDFTKHIYVEDKFVLPIAEKIDNTRAIFGDIVRKIKASANAVQSSADKTDKSSQELLTVSIEQYEKLEKFINKITQITSEMDEVAQVTWIAQEESNQSREASLEGGSLVQESISKMIEIRNTIQDSSKKIKKSSESAQAITEVTGLIRSITRQIEVLALNAAIQAVSSGESGREFTVVAQEVQRLALDSKEASDKILMLVQEVQEDIRGAVSSMEKTTQEVIEGTKLNDSAGKALSKIEALSQRVKEKVIEASQKLDEKSAEMATVSLQMKEVQIITQKNTDIVKQTVNQVIALNQVSKELEGSIHGFKVDD